MKNPPSWWEKAEREASFFGGEAEASRQRFTSRADQTDLEPNNTSDTDSDMRSESAFESRVSDVGIEVRE